MARTLWRVHSVRLNLAEFARVGNGPRRNARTRPRDDLASRRTATARRLDGRGRPVQYPDVAGTALVLDSLDWSMEQLELLAGKVLPLVTRP